MSILLSLPFTYGFVNTHWTHMTDFMLKKMGVQNIHILLIIGKVAAEFNTCLKFLSRNRHATISNRRTPAMTNTAFGHIAHLRMR